MRILVTATVTLFLSPIFVAADPHTPQWIWLGQPQENQSIVLRKVFDVPGDGDLGGAILQVVCDDTCVVRLNGQDVGRTTHWKHPLVADVTPHLKTGRKNVLTVRANNHKSAGGFLAKLDLKGPWSGSKTIVSDDSWEVHRESQDGWESADFADSWALATVIAPLGSKPWTEISATKLEQLTNVQPPATTSPGEIKVPDGFTVDLVYDVPGDTHGSWVSLCTKPDGSLIAGDQYGQLYQVTPGGTHDQTVVVPLDIEVSHVQGLLWAHDSLYAMVNRRGHGGIYRITDRDQDGSLDTTALLLPLPTTGGEHGPHAIVLSPDGESMYVVCGNQTELPTGEHAITSSRVPELWATDIVTPRIYGRAFMRDKDAPGGFVLRINEDATERELISIGCRNPYDAAFNWRGDLFTYDADMEWDWNTPWYRPTRICHVVDGSEWGWRNGSAKWPTHFPDTLPPVIDIGPGSPTGVCAGTNAKFPLKYQDAIFAADWTYGTLHAIHLQESGGSYRAERENFLLGTPLPITDVVVHPSDGAMYFTTGGRRIKSGLYRVRYTGPEDTSPVMHAASISTEHQLRQNIEQYIEYPSPDGLPLAWANLGHEDRFVRYAARTALEQIVIRFRHDARPRDIRDGADTLLALTSPRGHIEAVVAACRLADVLQDIVNDTPEELRSHLLDVLNKVDWSSLDQSGRHALVRAYGLIFTRLGRPAPEETATIIGQLATHLGNGPPTLDNDVFELLVAAGWDEAVPRGVELLNNAPTQEQQIAIAKSLRLVEDGWTDPTIRSFCLWVNKARSYKGGMSFELYVHEIRDAVLKRLTAEQTQVAEAILNVSADVPELTAEPRPFVRQWTVDEAMTLVNAGRLTGRNFDRGRQLYVETQCAACHRFGVDGGAMGPDLTALAGRFRPHDLLTSIIEPSKVISDQYAAKTFLTTDGRVVTGRVTNLGADQLRINTNMLDPSATIAVDRRLLEEVSDSPVSMMPTGLVDTLNEDELLDLVAYLLSQGKRNNAFFSLPAN